MTIRPAAAQAQNDTQFMIERINRLENDLRTLQRQVYRGGTPPAAAASGGGAAGEGSLLATDGSGSTIANRLNARIDDLEEQIRALTGRFEEVEFKSSQVQQRMDKLTQDVDFRLGELERSQQGAAPAADAAAAGADGKPQPADQQQNFARGSTSSTPGVAPTKEGVLGRLSTDASGKPLPVAPRNGQGSQAQGKAANPQTAVAPPSAAAGGKGHLPSGSPQEQYNYAYRLLVQSNYPDAEAAFREFLAQHPNDMLSGNAQYWLGETYYVRQQFEPAAQSFLAGYQNYPKSAKAPDSLLKLGMSLAALKKNAEACAALGQLAKEFPSAPPHVKDAATRERGKIGCK
ncbi:MAG TPA: tol-pal system protein YbgF [Alphaproteobacteria bacterium]